ncbi:Uncharacterized membrane protein YdjX, TVP38/TMEM64 family, SNARE-associated domain [Faunimonas pinastri]|uniref:Phospholipase D n=1 Tax=Faunimonas pinastri TaxID=1855383 RepID=A0A1H9A2N8_9HYPH|nr:Uncharacterized membrane protein YdjX, TVP38/TMEM64 family, SNARE-associated domain [Faunimonas pinastri]
MLVDAANYYGALRQAMISARRSILIVGWDIDSRTRLVGPGGEPGDDLPATFSAFLSALVERTPELSVKVLLWDYSVLYSLERELLPVMRLRWNTPRQVEMCLDDMTPVGAAHHQKVVVIDDKLAFAGGLDLTIRRWDTGDHEPHNPGRVDPAGKSYGAFHDIQMMVDGDAAMALGDLVRNRWKRVTCEGGEPVRLEDCPVPWPETVAPDLRDVDVGIARTQPLYGNEEEVREVETLFLDMLETAERTIYIENQFLAWTAFAERLAARLKVRPKLEALLVGPRTHHTWLEHRTMRNGRIRFQRILTEAGVWDRVRIMHPQVREHRAAHEVMIHAKLMIVDDRVLRVGSANLNHRSMGTDTECDLVVAARTEADRQGIAAVRNRLIAEHCGTTPSEVAEKLAATGSLLAAISELSTRKRGLAPIEDGEPDPEEISSRVEMVADPDRPIAPSEFLADFTEEFPPTRQRVPTLVKAAVAIAVVVGLVLAWKYTPLAEIANPSNVRRWLADLGGGPWAAVVVIGVYVLGGFVMFPIMVLIAATAAAFGGWIGAAYAISGAMASALVTYWIGRAVGPDVLRDILGPRINRIARNFARKGLVALTAARLAPIAPYSLFNLVAGAAGVGFVDFTIGTALGLAPGLIFMSSLGDQLSDAIRHPTLARIAVLVGICVVWIGVTYALQKLMTRIRGRQT